ncbi:MAG: hypothetical protein HUJ76_03240, partial [Parasporobacterium sp.]|nr:hypothetical protein [Parasporobacterium sp.]
DGWIDGYPSESLDLYNNYTDLIRKNIDYDLFEFRQSRVEKAFNNSSIDIDEYENSLASCRTGTVDSVIGYMLDVLCSTNKDPIIINNNTIPREIVKSKLLKADHEAMKSVVRAINTNPGIKNKKSYSISMLYNA